jgi:membrane protein implicated in regulation of membrane protease activity
MIHLFFYWLIIGLLFLLLELCSPGLFFFFSFFIGALGAAFAGLFEFSLYNQISIFFLISIILFIILCIWFKKNAYGIMPRHGYKTNIFALQGKRAEVIEEIVPMHTGLIKIGGEIWSAKGLENSKYDVGTIVEVVDIIGCHCIVRLIKEKN